MVPSISPLEALQRLKEEGEFSEDEWDFCFSPMAFDESCVSAVAVHTDGSMLATSGTDEEPVTEDSFWIEI